MIVEITPTRHRTVVASLFVISATLGVFLASSSVAALLGLIGWRGIAALGVIPAFIGLGVLFFVPKSVRWLIAKGRYQEAQATVATLLDLPLSAVPLPSVAPADPPRASLAELYARPGLFWLTLLAWGGAATAGYGMLLWGPTIVAQLMAISVRQAAHYFVYVTAAGIVGKFLFSFLARFSVAVGWARCMATASLFALPPRPISTRPCSAAFAVCRRLGVDRFLQFRRIFEPRTLHAGSLWRADGSARLRAWAGGKWGWQDRWTVEPRGHCRDQQCAKARCYRGGGVSGVYVFGVLRVGDRAGIYLFSARDARQGGAARCRHGAPGAPRGHRTQRPELIDQAWGLARSWAAIAPMSTPRRAAGVRLAAFIARRCRCVQAERRIRGSAPPIGAR